MTRKFTFLLMALLTLAGFKSWGQTTILSEDFEHEGDFPTGWTATHNSNSGEGWTCTTNNNNIANGYGGTGYSVFCQGSSDGLTDYLTTSAIDFSGYSRVSMSFYFVNRAWAGDKNELRVEYSDSTSGPWTSLWSNTAGTGNHNSWTAANVDISVLGGGTYYLRFVDVNKWGHGVALDDIVITGSNPQFYSITYDNSIQHGSISGPTEAYEGHPVTLTATPDEMYELDRWTVTNTTTSETIPVVNNQFTMPESDVTVTATFAYYLTLTVNDGTGANQYVPIFGYYVDTQSYPETQFIIPKESLTSMLGGEISKLTFYTNYNCNFGDAKWDIYIGETDNTTLSSAASHDGCTLVYSGNLAITGNKLIIQLDDTYLYEGNNLLVCFNETQRGTCYYSGNDMFYGVSATDGASGYMYDSWTKQSFLPKTTFSYTSNPNRHHITVNQPAEGGTISAPATALPGNVVTLTATPELGYMLGQWIVADADGGTVTVTDNSFEMPAKDITVTATFESAGEMYSITLPELDPEIITGIDALFNGEHIDQAPEGTEITLVYATLNEGYTFNYWTLNGAQLPSSTFTMPDGNAEIGVNLSERPRYAVNIDGSITNGTITANPSTNVLSGTTVTLTITPADGYDLASLSVTDGSGNLVPVTNNQFSMPESNVNVSATFISMLTVNDGTVINCYIPVNGFYCGASSQQNQFIIPAELLAEMNGGTISDMTFYLKYLGAWDCTWTVKLMETTETTISSLIDVSSAISVYTGILNGQSGTMKVPFATSYVYNGGNLLVDFSYSGESDSNDRAYFYGVSAPDNSSYSQFIDYNDNTCYGPQAFLPKTTFYYTASPNLHHITVNQPAEGGTISAPATALSGNVVTLAVTPEIGYTLDEWIVKDAENNEIPVTDNSFEMPASDVTVTATFNTATLYDITFTGVDETLITVAAKYNGEVITAAQEGIEVTLEYTWLDEGCIFNYWTLDGEPLTGNTFTMPATDVEIGVSLTERPRFAVNIDGSIANGTITANPSTNVLGGTTVTLTITPDAGYGLGELTVTDADSNPVDVTNNQFAMPESDITITATFVPMLTVYDGTTINQNAAVYTYYGDTKNSAAQFVIPASQLEAMAGGTISSLKFYVDPTQTFWQNNLGGPVYAGYIMEVEETAMSSFIDFGAATNMFNGHVALTNGDSELVIDFAEPFTYNGGNLAIAFECTAKASYTRLYYYGTTVTGGGIYRNGATADATANNFIPKTTFYYTPDEGPEYNAMEITANQDPNHKTHYYSTFYSSTNAYQVPEGVTAYTGAVNGDVLNLTSIADGIIPAGEAVILRLTTADNTATKKQFALTATTTTATKSTNNALTGTDVAIEELGKNDYALTLGQHGVGFYLWDGLPISAHKAYLTLKSPAMAKAFTFMFEDGETTAIEQPTINEKQSGNTYNLNGVRVNDNYKGIVIKNGKKVYQK